MTTRSWASFWQLIVIEMATLSVGLSEVALLIVLDYGREIGFLVSSKLREIELSKW